MVILLCLILALEIIDLGRFAEVSPVKVTYTFLTLIPKFLWELPTGLTDIIRANYFIIVSVTIEPFSKSDKYIIYIL